LAREGDHLEHGSVLSALSDDGSIFPPPVSYELVVVFSSGSETPFGSAFGRKVFVQRLVEVAAYNSSQLTDVTSLSSVGASEAGVSVIDALQVRVARFKGIDILIGNSREYNGLDPWQAEFGDILQPEGYHHCRAGGHELPFKSED
jgi:hypothetical protein